MATSDRAGFIPYDIDNIYYNVVKGNTTTVPILARYEETFQQPLLDISNNFIFTVVRMKMPSSAIPIFIFDDGQYVVTVENPAGTYHQQTVLYVPQNSATSFPANRYIFSYKGFIEMVNNALDAAATAAGLAGSDIPFLVYDPQSKLITLYASDSWFPANPAGPKLWFNTKLFNYFSSFQVFFAGFTPTTANVNYNILVGDTIVNHVPAATLPAPYNGANMLAVSQEYDVLFSWNDAQRILILSQSFPNNPEKIASRDQSGAPLTQSLLIDFEVQTLPFYKEYVFFNNDSSFPIRWQNLLSNEPLRNFGMQVYWQSQTDGEIYPLYLNPLTEMSIKFQFTRRPNTYGLTHIPTELKEIPLLEKSRTAQDKTTLDEIKTGKFPKMIGSGSRRR